MSILTANNFKSTIVRGNFNNEDDTVNNILANGTFQRDLTVGGNIIFNNGVDLLTMLISDYVTQIDFQTFSLSLNNYQLISNMINYVTNANLITMLSSYALTTSLTNYITNSSLNTTLTNYVTNTNLNSTLNNYITNSSLTSSLTNYITNSSLNTSLSNYALISSLSNYALISSLSNYVLTSSLNTTLTNYVLTSSLTNYVTNTSLNSTLTNYVLKSSLSNYANLTAASNIFTGNFQIGSLNNNGSPTLLIYAQTTINGDVWLNYDVNIGTVNNFFNVMSISYFESLVTFNTGINTTSILLNGVDLNTRLNTYVLTTSLNTTLTNYVTNTNLNSTLTNYVTNTNLNSTLKTLTHTAGLGFNASTFPSSSSGDYKYGYEVFWNNSNGGGETDFLAYGQGGSGGFKFYSLNTSSTSSTPYELIYTHPTVGTIINTNLTVNGIQNSCRKSITYLTSTINLTAANLTSIYVVTNNATINFNCFSPTQNVTDGYELCIRNGGTGTVNVTGCVPLGANINTVSFSIPLYQSCKMISGAGYWYQI